MNSQSWKVLTEDKQSRQMVTKGGRSIWCWQSLCKIYSVNKDVLRRGYAPTYDKCNLFCSCSIAAFFGRFDRTGAVKIGLFQNLIIRILDMVMTWFHSKLIPCLKTALLSSKTLVCKAADWVGRLRHLFTFMFYTFKQIESVENYGEAVKMDASRLAGWEISKASQWWLTQGLMNAQNQRRQTSSNQLHLQYCIFKDRGWMPSRRRGKETLYSLLICGPFISMLLVIWYAPKVTKRFCWSLYCTWFLDSALETNVTISCGLCCFYCTGVWRAFF